MSINDIRKFNKGSAILVYNNFRIGLTILGPLLLIIGILDLGGCIESKGSIAGNQTSELWSLIGPLLLFTIGMGFIFLRMTLFKNKRISK